jgi:hypothetical protein
MVLRFASSIPFCKGDFHDPSSTTNDRGSAGAQSLPAHPSHLSLAGFPLCPPLPPVTGSFGPRGDSLLPGLPDQPEETISQFSPHRRRRSAFPLQGHSAPGLEPARHHPRTQETAEVTCRSQPTRGPSLSELRHQPQASRHPHHLLRRRPPRLRGHPPPALPHR